MAIVVITDSTADLPSSSIDRYNIKVVPLNIKIQDTVFKEGFGPSNQQYYHILRTTPVFPTTSQPSAGDFVKEFSSLDSGDEAIVILISSHLSGTVQSAQMAKKMVSAKGNFKITIVDSETTTAALGFQVTKAAELAQSNPELKTDDILAEIERIKRNQRLYFVVDNLEYLARGGRIGQISKHLGNILQVKPILHINHGKIEVFEKVRTKPRALTHILEEFESNLHSVEKVAVIHVDALEEALALQNKIQQLYSGEVIIAETGPVIGSHAGPGALGLVFY
ncbi:MAG: DegV family protein [Syntrophomonadaceae bacterium]|nr:DegV family protein [Syntrophomonadaceae bacterium]